MFKVFEPDVQLTENASNEYVLLAFHFILQIIQG